MTINQAPTSTDVNTKPWYREGIVYILCILFFFPGFMMLVITDPKEKNAVKIIVVLIQISMCCLAVFAGLVMLNNLGSSG